MRSRRVAIFGWLLFVGALLALEWEPRLRGQVVGPDGPVAGAQVRWQGERSFVVTDGSGHFAIRPKAKAVRLTAWKAGFRIAALDWPADVVPVGRISNPSYPAAGPLLRLSPLPVEDNYDYHWLPPDPDPATPVACGNCHQTIHAEWAGSAHARSAKNPRLIGLMTGRDIHGKEQPAWNLSREHPLGLGVCSRCHAPTYRSPDLSYDLEKAEGVAARGVHCDLCHKVSDVPTGKLGGRFGIDALDLLRPQDGEQLFYGPLQDAVRPGESFGHFPVYKESRYCAACHEGTVFGVRVYTTYSEWRDSPAAQRGLQCQSCHMAPTGKMTNVAPGKGGVERDPRTLASHAMVGSSKGMLQKSVQVTARVEEDAKGVTVTVELTARNVGHRVPTGFIDRHLLLVVEAWDAAGKEIGGDGPRQPASLVAPWQEKAVWVFGRRLVDETGKTPLPFWLPRETEEDTRLIPEKTEQRTARFASGAARVRVRLIYRPFWPAVLESRGWGDREMMLAEWGYRREGGVWLTGF